MFQKRSSRVKSPRVFALHGSALLFSYSEFSENFTAEGTGIFVLKLHKNVDGAQSNIYFIPINENRRNRTNRLAYLQEIVTTNLYKPVQNRNFI